MALRRRSLDAVGGTDRAQRLAPGPNERDPPVVAAELPVPDPGDLAERAQLVEEARLVARDPGRQDVALQHRRGHRHAGELIDDLGEALEGGRARNGAGVAPARGDPVPGRAGTGPAPPDRPARPRAGAARATVVAAAAGRPGRTTRVRRRRAGTRRASSVPARGSRSSASSTIPTGSPQRRAGSGDRNGPCVRAQRASSDRRARPGRVRGTRRGSRPATDTPIASR